MIDKVGVKRAFLLAVLLWSVAAGAHGFAVVGLPASWPAASSSA
ncbi:hypothetical protein ACU4GD_03065 [Cupriavidus basilensis]